MTHQLITLSTADRQKVEQYLSNKYAIALA
jgi:hypothetical protein